MAPLPDRIAAWRNRLLADTAFRGKLQRLPFGRGIARRRARALFAINVGFINSQVLAALLELDLLERLASGPASAEELARELAGEPDGGQTLDPLRLERLLEAGAELDLTEPRRKSRWGLGSQGAVLASDPGLLAMSLHHRALYTDLADPVALLRQDPPPTELSRLWPYAVTDQPQAIEAQDTKRYTALMAASQRMIAEQVLGAFDFSPFDRLLDVGGGSGAFLAAVGKAHADLSLGLFDLPGVIPHAAENLEAAGLGPRLALHGGNFHEDALPTGYDLISLVRIVHDHDDDPARQLLEKAFEALPPGGTLLLAEPLTGRGDRDGLVGNYFRFYLMAMGSGRPRTARELRRTLKKTGFHRIRHHRTDIPLICSVLSARKPDAGQAT
ncbi:MAG: methyltransferase [Xanthomonadales bacterium]|jgi:demethylspheroidene O-methyltransferase|nr:methyltransferase [Xanthomonadales bacterium]